MVLTCISRLLRHLTSSEAADLERSVAQQCVISQLGRDQRVCIRCGYKKLAFG
jgi:hypothetical protein